MMEDRDWCRRCMADFPTDEEIEADQRDENSPDMVIEECRMKGCGALYICWINQQPYVDHDHEGYDESLDIEQTVLPF